MSSLKVNTNYVLDKCQATPYMYCTYSESNSLGLKSVLMKMYTKPDIFSFVVLSSYVTACFVYFSFYIFVRAWMKVTVRTIISPQNTDTKLHIQLQIQVTNTNYKNKCQYKIEIQIQIQIQCAQ